MCNFITTFFFFFALSFVSSSYGHNWSSHTFTSNNNLPVLNASIHWNYHPNNRTVDIAYKQTGTTRSNWVAWALNPSGRGMVGSQALVAFLYSNGSVRAYTSPVTSYATTLPEGPLSFRVSSLAAEFSCNYMIIYATIQLPRGSTRFTQVWQHGRISWNTPRIHPVNGDHLRSIGTIDFASAEPSTQIIV